MYNFGIGRRLRASRKDVLLLGKKKSGDDFDSEPPEYMIVEDKPPAYTLQLDEEELQRQRAMLKSFQDSNKNKKHRVRVDTDDEVPSEHLYVSADTVRSEGRKVAVVKSSPGPIEIEQKYDHPVVNPRYSIELAAEDAGSIHEYDEPEDIGDISTDMEAVEREPTASVSRDAYISVKRRVAPVSPAPRAEPELRYSSYLVDEELEMSTFRPEPDANDFSDEQIAESNQAAHDDNSESGNNSKSDSTHKPDEVARTIAMVDEALKGELETDPELEFPPPPSPTENNFSATQQPEEVAAHIDNAVVTIIPHNDVTEPESPPPSPNAARKK